MIIDLTFDLKSHLWTGQTTNNRQWPTQIIKMGYRLLNIVAAPSLEYSQRRKITDFAIKICQIKYCILSSEIIRIYCQTPIPGQTWELTLLSRGNERKKKKKNNNKNPHLNSPRRGCVRGLKFCMRPSVTIRIRLHP